ncbi:MAG: hypothetical protein M1839_006323, partial [Geoglossum umbratile]
FHNCFPTVAHANIVKGVIRRLRKANELDDTFIIYTLRSSAFPIAKLFANERLWISGSAERLILEALDYYVVELVRAVMIIPEDTIILGYSFV